MIRTRLIIATLVTVLVLGVFGRPAHADSLEIHPTIYRDITLAKGERKKAFVDVVNPSGDSKQISLTVKAFRQIDDSGTLTFYDSEQVSAGIALDVTDVELGAHEAIRVYFFMDGAKLPNGDVFAAIFARTSPRAGAAAQSVEVGSLLSIVNGTPPIHSADIANLDASFLQVGEGLSANFAVSNRAKESSGTGFFPSIHVDAKPYGGRAVEGPLLFAGRTRSVAYSQSGNYFGPILLRVDAGGEAKTVWVLAATGYWRWLAPLLAISFLVLAVLAYWRILVPMRRYHR